MRRRNTAVPCREAAEIEDSGRRLAAEGFTLLELLIAIAIILILVATTVPNMMRMQQSARRTAILADLRTLSQELGTYSMDCGGYPRSLDGLNPASEEGCPKGSVAFSVPMTLSGYRLNYKAANPDENGLYKGYTLTADPCDTTVDGAQFFFMDQNGIIRVHLGASATASDPALIP